jgi:hypothetical protein
VPERNELALPRELLILDHETTPLFPYLRADRTPRVQAGTISGAGCGSAINEWLRR